MLIASNRREYVSPKNNRLLTLTRPVSSNNPLLSQPILSSNYGAGKWKEGGRLFLLGHPFCIQTMYGADLHSSVAHSFDCQQSFGNIHLMNGWTVQTSRQTISFQPFIMAFNRRICVLCAIYSIFVSAAHLYLRKNGIDATHKRSCASYSPHTGLGSLPLLVDLDSWVFCICVPSWEFKSEL